MWNQLHVLFSIGFSGMATVTLYLAERSSTLGWCGVGMENVGSAEVGKRVGLPAPPPNRN